MSTIQAAMISIIVPVYNAQAFIDPCINSVLTQSFQELELILIDDGSTDDSLKKCRRWEADPRVTVISTENRGVSSARNAGLSAASGQWIMFLDSDDYLLPDCLDRLMALVTPDTQLILAAYADDETVSPAACRESVRADSVHAMTLDPYSAHLLPDFYEVKPLSLPSSCSKLYRSDVIRENGIGFCEALLLSEDTLFNLDYLSRVEQVTVTDLQVTYYRQNTASVTRSFHPEHLSNRFRFFGILKERYGQNAAVHILSLLFLELSKIERYAKGHERALLEKEIIRFLSDNPDILSGTKNRSLSNGKFQKILYQTAARCFSSRAYRTGFALFRAYAAATSAKFRMATTHKH